MEPQYPRTAVQCGGRAMQANFDSCVRCFVQDPTGHAPVQCKNVLVPRTASCRIAGSVTDMQLNQITPIP